MSGQEPTRPAGSEPAVPPYDEAGSVGAQALADGADRDHTLGRDVTPGEGAAPGRHSALAGEAAPTAGTAPAGATTMATAAPRVVRSWPGVVARVAAVVVASAVVYALVVPVTSVERSRIDLLVARPNGTADYTGAPKLLPKQASAAHLAALTADAKVHPGSTGVIVADWQHGNEDGLISVVLLASSAGVADRVQGQLATQALSAKAYTSQGLIRRATFSVPGAVGAMGSTFATTSATDGGSISIATVRSGRAVALVEVIATTGSPQADAVVAARAAATHLDATIPGFTLSPTRYPELASILWVVGTVVVATVVGAGPVLRRTRRKRREQERLDEQARMIRVRGTTVVRTRRG